MIWMHSRKGRIEGEIVSESIDGVWATIRLAGNQALRWASEENRGRVDFDGSHLTVRKSLLTELNEEVQS